jgi:hypothetical protein
MTVSGTADRRQRPRFARDTLALAGAWMPSVFGSSVLLPQQVEALVGAPTWPAAYAAISAVGWLTVVVGLTLSGRLQDVGWFGGADDRRTLPVLALLTAVGGLLVPLAGSVLGLAVLWVGAMLAPAVAVTLISVRTAGRQSTTGPSVVASASAIGAAPLLAMLAGSLLIRIPTLTGPERMMLVALVAAALLLGVGRPTDREVVLTRDTGPLPPASDPVVRGALRRHARLLAGVALVDTGTVALTFVIVPLVFLLPRSAVGDPGGFAELLVLAAAVCALVAVWVVPRLPVLRASPRLLFVASGLAMAVALVIGPFAEARLLAGAALLAGLAAGSSNAATFGVFLSDPASHVHRATGLGLLNAMPSMPAVVVPMFAAALLRATPATGLTVVMLIAAAAASVGALLVGVAGRTR